MTPVVKSQKRSLFALRNPAMQELLPSISDANPPKKIILFGPNSLLYAIF